MKMNFQPDMVTLIKDCYVERRTVRQTKGEAV